MRRATSYVPSCGAPATRRLLPKPVAGRLILEEYQGTLSELERLVAGLVFSAQNGSAYRRVLVDLYRRLLPSVYRAPASSAPAAEDYARMGNTASARCSSSSPTPRAIP